MYEKEANEVIEAYVEYYGSKLSQLLVQRLNIEEGHVFSWLPQPIRKEWTTIHHGTLGDDAKAIFAGDEGLDAELSEKRLLSFCEKYFSAFSGAFLLLESFFSSSLRLQLLDFQKTGASSRCEPGTYVYGRMTDV
jgi:hypothetical protein